MTSQAQDGHAPQDIDPAPARRVEVTLNTPGRAKVEVLTTKLMAMQRLLWNVGASLTRGGLRRRVPSEVIHACSLYFENARAGSTVVSAVLPEPTTLFEEADLGSRALRRMIDTLDAVGQGNSESIAEMYPDPRLRSQVVHSIRPLAPEEDSEYSVVVRTNGSVATLDDRYRTQLQSAVREVLDVPEQEVRRLTGHIYLIEVGTGSPHVGVKSNGRNIACFYESSFESEVRDLIPGSLVEVEGLATLNANGDVDRIERITDLVMVEPLVPLNWTKVDYGNRRFHLRNPIQIDQDYSAGLWTCTYDTLGLMSYAPTRHEALVGWRARFAANWDDIALEADPNLTLDARDLKLRMLASVSSVETLT